MASFSKIEWTDATWTPIRARNLETGKTGWHCQHVSPGCENCYSETLNRRIGSGLAFKPGHLKAVDVFLDEKMISAPMRWRSPRRIFVCSMTDLFGEWMRDEWIDRVFDIVEQAPQHIYQILTKRAYRMQWYFEDRFAGCIPKNAWVGVSVENDEYLERIYELRQIPAAVRFLSLEPLLSSIENIDLRGIHWVIVGGESGPRKRPVDLAWMRSIRDQCLAAGVPLFVKQIDKRIPIPEDLMIRQWPKGAEQ